MTERTSVFVSYSHMDKEYLARLKVHIRPFERADLVELWSDTKIVPGSDWRIEIASAIDRAAAAILLVSADFLASDFIADNELPPLLEAAKEDGLRILPVILKPCAFTDIDSLSRFQAINDPEAPMLDLSEADRERLWVEVARTARVALPLEAPPEQEAISEIHESTYWWPDPELTLLGEELRDPTSIQNYFVYQYHFFDSLAYMKDAEPVLSRVPNGDEILQNVRSHLSNAGWEGDGRLQLLWLPPFLGAGVEDTFGVCVWHVKQDNNGTSWFASPVPLEFKRLQEQN